MPTHKREAHVRRDGTPVAETVVRTRGARSLPPPPAAVTAALRAQAEADAAAAEAGREVEAVRCSSCEGIFSSAGGALYTCSRCGADQVDENRCLQCHIFMAKTTEATCPDCQDSSELTEITGWEQGGKLFESAEAAQEWEASAEERERQAEASRLRTAAFIAAHNDRRRVANQALLPRLVELRSRIDPEAAPQLASALDYSLGRLAEKGDESPSDLPIYYTELARMLVPDCEDDLALVTSFRRPHEERTPVMEALRERMRARVRHPALLVRMDNFFTAGAGTFFEAEEAVDILSDCLDFRGEREAANVNPDIDSGPSGD